MIPSAVVAPGAGATFSDPVFADTFRLSFRFARREIRETRMQGLTARNRPRGATDRALERSLGPSMVEPTAVGGVRGGDVARGESWGGAG